jgi:DNA-binding CsgD family transcriptional regulator
MEGLANLVDLGVIWLSSDNTIEWMSNLSERWLREYFPRAELAPSTGPRQLSRSLTSWIGKQKSAQQTAAALGWRAEQTVLGPNGSLSVRWLCDQPDRSYLILSEHRTNHLPEKLRSLGLTVRETEVLHWVAEGKSNEAIGILLGLSRRTVDKHMENVLRKLAVESRTEAALKAAACQRAS